MKRSLGVFIIMCFAAFYICSAHAGVWDKCKVCHNGIMAPDEKTLKKRYTTTAEFMKAAKESPNSMMNSYKGDADLREAAKSLGLK